MPASPPGPGDGEPTGSKAGWIIGGVVALLAVLGVGAFFLTRDDDDEAEVTIPDEVTLPDEITLPDEVTFPDISLPDVTLPDITLPDITLPDISAPPGGSLPDPTEEPDGLGDDANLNALAQDCYDGEMRACDDLYNETAADDALEAYNVYGDTCGGRQDEGTGVYCTDAFRD